MKKRLLSALLALCMVVGMLPASARAEETPAPAYELRTLTFEDADYKGGNNMVGKKDWSSLIDNPQYSGSLLYPTNGVVYNWYDEGNTYLKHQFTDEWGDHQYWGGGEAISNYNSGDVETYGDYKSQLTVYKSGVEGLATTGGGHNGSNNFAVHYGYVDSSAYGGTKLQALTFGDGVARVIDHMYVNNICYALNCYTNGNDLTASIGEDDWVKLVATGHHTDGTTATAEIYLCNGPEKIVKDWTKWDLSGLGEITKLELNVMGSSDNGYGFSQPAYFAYDDVAVRFPVTEVHTCTFDQKVVSEDFLATEADCTNAATYYYSCACGKKGTETFTDGEAAGHHFEGGVCVVCNAPCLTVLEDAPTGGTIKAGELYQVALNEVFAECGGHQVTYSFDTTVTNQHTKIQNDTFVFSAKEVGTYEVKLTADCGQTTVTHTLNIKVEKASEGLEAQYNYDETDKSSVTVYVTLSNDGMPIQGDDGTIMAHLEVTVPYFDLSLYGLERYNRYGTDGGQGAYTNTTVIKRPTGLHLYIYLLERYYLGLPEEECCLGTSGILDITDRTDVLYMDGERAYTSSVKALDISGLATSLFLSNFWGHDCNLMYFRNHCYPYMSAGWGATADYILLSDGDSWDVGLFTNWKFNTSGGFFACFDKDDYTADPGEELTVSTLYWGTTSSSGDFKEKTGLTVKLYDSDWEYIKTLSYNEGTNSLTFAVPEEAGEYYLLALEPNATDPELAKGAPAAAKITVGGSSGSVDISSYYDKYDFISVKDDQGRYLVDIKGYIVSTNYNGDVPAHQITVEEGTETVYVTYPAEKSFVVYSGKYSVEDAAESGYGKSVTLTTNADGTITVGIPVVKYLDTGNGILLENGSYQMTCGFDFVTGTITKVEVGSDVTVSRILLNIYNKKLVYNSETDNTFQIAATVLPAEASGWTIQWSSSNEAVATVDENGLVTAISEGEAVITAAIGDITASCTIDSQRYNTAPVLDSQAVTRTKIKAGATVTLSDVSAYFTDEQGDALTFTANLATPASVGLSYEYDYSVGDAISVGEDGSCSYTFEDTGVYALKITASDGNLETSFYYQVTVVPNDSGIVAIGEGMTLDIFNVAVVGHSAELVEDFEIPYKGTHDTIVHHIVLSKSTIDGNPYRKMDVQVAEGYGWCEYASMTPGQSSYWQTRADIGLFAADLEGNLTAHFLQFHTECEEHTDADDNGVCEVCTLRLRCETCVDENGDKICDVCGALVNKVPVLLEGVTNVSTKIQTGQAYQLKDLELGKIFTDPDGDKLTYASYFYKKSSDGGETWGELTGFTASLFGGNDMTFVNDQEGTYIYEFWAYDGYGYSEQTWKLTLIVMDIVPADINFYVGYDQNYKNNGNVFPVMELYRTAGIDDDFNDYVGWFVNGAGETVRVYNPHDYVITDGETDYVTVDGAQYELHDYEKMTFTNSAFNDADETATASGTVVGSYNMFYATLLTGRYSTRFYGYNTTTSAYDIYLGGQSMALPMELDIYGGGGNNLYFRIVSVYTTSKKIDGSYFTADDYVAQITMPITGSNIQSGDPYVTGNYTYYPFMSWANGNGSLYNVYAYPKDKENYVFTQAINQTTVAGASVVTKNMTINTAVELKITVPEDGEFGLFFQYNNFNTKAVEPKGEAVSNGDGTKTLTYTVSKGNSNYTWRLTDPSGTYVTSGGWVKSISTATEMTYTYSEATNKTNHDFSQLGTIVATRDEADVQLFASHSGFLSTASTTRIRAYRMWQLINSDTANIMVEPDYNVQVLQGNAGDIVQVNGGNGGGNWLDVTPSTTDIVAVNYDSMDVYADNGTHGSHGGLYPATNPERTAVMVVTNEAAGTADASIRFNGSLDTNRGSEWDYNYDTWFYMDTDEAPMLDFTVSATGDVTVSWASVITDSSLNSTLSGWTALTPDERGAYHADLLCFRNAGTLGGTVIIKMTDSTGTSYRLARVAQMHVTVSNATFPGEALTPGSSVKLTFDGLYRSVNKIAGIFNPTTYYLRYTANGAEVNGQLGQYQQMDRASITIPLPENVEMDENGKATYTFTNGYIYGQMYSAVSPFSTMYQMTDTGVGTNFSAASINFVLSRLADVTVEVETMSTFDVTVDVTDGENAVTDYAFILTDANGNIVTPDETGIYRQLEWGTYSYVLKASGYIYDVGTMTVGSDYADKKAEDGTVHWAFQLVKGSEGCWDGTTSEPALVDGVYQIGTGAELAWFAGYVNAGNTTASAVLTADIDLAAYEWTPIGNSSVKFAGSFDGQDHTISNLAIRYASTSSSIPYVGLFGYVQGTSSARATVCNLTVDGEITMTSTGNVNTAYSGGIIGYAKYADLTNLHNEANVTVNRVKGNWDQIGGIVSYADNCTISDCSNSGSITGYRYVGGIAATLASGTMTRCYNVGTVTSGYSYIGGVVAKSNTGTVVSECYNAGAVNGGSTYAGGIAGYVTGTLTGCYNVGSVTATGTKTGGVVGYGWSSDNSTCISNCFTTGTITDTSNEVGAALGYMHKVTITNVYCLEGIHEKTMGGSNSSTGEPVAVSAETIASAEFVTTMNAGLETPVFIAGETHPILSWEQETVVLTTLSALGIYSTYSSADADIYPMTPAFDPAVKEYTVAVPDSTSMCYAKATLAEGVTGTITAAWTNLNVDQDKTATITSGKTSGQTLAGAVKTGNYKNTVTFTVTGEDFEDVYTLNIVRTPTLTGLALEGMKLSPTFTSATTAYTATTAQDSVTVAATPRDESYTVTVNGTDSNEVALEMGENVIHVVVKNADGYETTYTITVTRKEAITVSFETNVENPNIVMKDSNKIQVIPVDGVYTLITGETYSYTIQKDGYVGQMNSFTLTESGVIEITLVQATENPDLNKNIYAQWGNFRKGDNNLGITDAPTPYAPEDAELLWAVKYGTGWSAAPGSPIMVDGDIITYIGSSIKRLDRMTGAVKAEGTMVGKSSFSIVPATYADGMIFVGLSGGVIQAFNAVTLESLWVYTDDLGGQPNCPITYKDGYVYAGFWNNETRDAHFACISTIDEDHENTTEAKLASWTYTRAGGFYWAGAYVTDKLAIVGTDDGQSGSNSDSSSLLVFDRFTGELLDHRDGIHGDIRSNVSHDPDSDRIFFTSKGGVLCNAKVDWTTGKITDFHQVVLQDANGTEYAMSTCTPSVYNGRIYIGVCGASQFGDNSGHAIAVYDLNSDGTMTRAYAYAIVGYPQTSTMVTTAYADEDDGSVYIYLPYNAQPGGVSVLKDKKGQTAPITTTDEGYSEVFTPVSPLNQYCICSTIADEYGTIYYKNDSCYMMAITSKIESLELVSEPTFTVKDDGTYEVSGLKVVTHQKNGTTRDVTNYATVDYNAETGAYSVSYTYGLDSDNYGLKTLTVYSVTQPDCDGITFTGDTAAAAGEDYTFTVAVKPCFQAGEDFAVKANGETLTANEDGSYTIPGVAESIVITVEDVEPVTIHITVYYADNGTIVTGKDGTVLNFAAVNVTDVNGDGKLTMYDGFYCFHEKYHVNGAAGYTDNNWVSRFWSIDTSMVSYGHNNRWVYSTAEEIAEGDSLCLFTYQDGSNWSDLYTYFDSLTDTATANEEKTFHVNGYSFFGSGRRFDAVAVPVGATVTATCGDRTLTTTTDAEGNFKLTFPSAGEWTILVNGKCSYTCDAGYYAGQTYTNAPVTPAMMTVTVEAPTYTITLSEDKSFTISPCTGYTTSVKEGESFKFYVETSVGYQPGENFAVKADGETLTADGLGNYTVENVTGDVTITVEGMEAIIWEPVTVYFSISHDGQFQTGKESDEVMALRKISVPYFDLGLYGLEDFYFSSETYGSDGGEHSSALEPGTPQYAYGKTTLLHLYIYALEVYYCGLDESEAGKGYLYNENLIGTDVLTITGSSGSLYMNQFWGGDENLNYYVNYMYPLASEGWGSTSDQILLRENDVITLGHFTSWSFYSDPEMGFNYLTPDEANKVYGSTTVTQGDKLTLTAYRAGADMTGNYTTGHYKLASEPTVYYAEYDSVTSDVTKWTKLGTVSADGTIVFDTTSLKPGTYVVAMAGQYGKDYTDDIVSTPGGILVVVEEKETTPGDVNGDGKISVVDVAMVQMYLKGKNTLTEDQLANADVNGDGKVTSLDVSLMNLYIKNKLDSFPNAK